MTRILIVDDSPSVLRLLQFLFESEHYEIVTAADAAEGLEKVRQQVPDLIVTDSIMPGMDGFAFVRKLKEDPSTSAVPVIMLTSEDPAIAEHADRLPKPDALVRKSADFEPLLNQVREALHCH